MSDHDLGVMLGRVLKGQQKELNLAPVEASLRELARVVADSKKENLTINADAINFDPEKINEALGVIASGLSRISAKNIDGNLGNIAASLDNIYEAMPEYDLGEIATAIQDAPDLRPALGVIAEAIQENTAALRENTAALEAQRAVMMKDRMVSYDESGKISKVSVR